MNAAEPSSPPILLAPEVLASRILERGSENPASTDAVSRDDRALRDDLDFLIEHLSQALSVGNADIFLGCVRWFGGRNRSRSRPRDFTLSCLQILHELLEDESRVPPEILEEYFDCARKALAKAEDSTQLDLSQGPQGALASEVLELLLKGERHAAAMRLDSAVESGLSLAEVYLEVFQPVLEEVGRRWERNEITVAHEHYCSAAIQLQMARLSAGVHSGRRQGPRMVAAAAPSEQHEFGLRMVADLAEEAGWDTHYLGAALPKEDLLAALRDFRPHVVALTGSLDLHLREIAELISAVRQDPQLQDLYIMLGGRPFSQNPDLARLLGADDTAGDAAKAVQRATQWFEAKE